MTPRFLPRWPRLRLRARSPPWRRPSAGASATTTPSCAARSSTTSTTSTPPSARSALRSPRRLAPFEAAVTILSSITGVSRTTAEVMIAEMGVDMSRFPTAGHLCAWAGVAPASHESAGKNSPAGTRKGAPWLRRALIEAAKAAARTKGSYFSAHYARIARRRGPNKATVAVANSILAVAWHLLTNGALYEDPGSDYFDRRNDPVREAKRLQHRIEALGFEVTITERAA